MQCSFFRKHCFYLQKQNSFIQTIQKHEKKKKEDIYKKISTKKKVENTYLIKFFKNPFPTHSALPGDHF